ncbi:MAG: hypothetical protein ABW116_06720 [Candidatus Sedimenticola sp. 20ELBAFRAG]
MQSTLICHGLVLKCLISQRSGLLPANSPFRRIPEPRDQQLDGGLRFANPPYRDLPFRRMPESRDINQVVIG